MVQLEPKRSENAALVPEGVSAFLLAGTGAVGDYRCAQCGYGVTVRQMLPQCPMCRGGCWEEPATSPFAGSRF